MFLQLDYELIFQAPSHFGTGIREGLIDRTVIRDTNGDLYVPASTFKGVLREHCEHLCHFYAPGGQKQRISSPHDAKAVLAEFGGISSLLSLTFGSPLFPGPLLFSDARPPWQMREIYRGIQVATFTQVRIDRSTRIAADEALYSSQFGIRDLIFVGTITGQLGSPSLPDLAWSENTEDKGTILAPTYALLLLLAGLLMIERLGGNKSTGKGQCRCTIPRLLLDRHYCPEKTWREWLEHLDVLENYLDIEKGWSS